MRRGFIVPALILALSVFIAACDSVDNGRTSAPDSSVKMTDTELENAIKAKWKADPALRTADLSVSADVEKKTATLSGDVSTEAMRTTAVQLAKAVHNGLIVTDKIDVKPAELTRAEYTDAHAQSERTKAASAGEKIGDSLDDAWIHTKIVTKLVTNSATPQRKINVDVVNNIVTLRGAVNTTEERTEAERVASTTEGVKKVVNQLKVSKNA